MANAVGIIMGSRSDWGVMENAAKVLDELGVSYEAKLSLRTEHPIVSTNTHDLQETED